MIGPAGLSGDPGSGRDLAEAVFDDRLADWVFFPNPVPQGGDWPGPMSYTAEGKLNGGGPILKVRTTTGDIKFLRASR